MKRKPMTSKEMRQARSFMGLSQEGLARQLNVSLRTISRYESGEVEITFVVQLALAQIVSIHMTYTREVPKNYAPEHLNLPF